MGPMRRPAAAALAAIALAACAHAPAPELAVRSEAGAPAGWRRWWVGDLRLEAPEGWELDDETPGTVSIRSCRARPRRRAGRACAAIQVQAVEDHPRDGAGCGERLAAAETRERVPAANSADAGARRASFGGVEALADRSDLARHFFVCRGPVLWAVSLLSFPPPGAPFAPVWEHVERTARFAGAGPAPAPR